MPDDCRTTGRLNLMLPLAAALLISACGGDGGAPDPVIPPPAPPPPAPLTPIVQVQRIVIADRPFAIAVSQEGVALVARLDASRVSKLLFQNDEWVDAGSFEVGQVPTDVQFSGDGRQAYVTNQFSRSVGVLDIATNTMTQAVHVQGSPFRVTPLGNSRLGVAGNNGSIQIIDLTAGSVVSSFPGWMAPNALAVAGQGPQLLYVGDPLQGTVSEVDAGNGNVLREHQLGGKVQEVRITPDGSEAWIVSETGTLHVWDLAEASVDAPIHLPSSQGGFGLAISPDGRAVAVTNGMVGRIYYYDRVTRELINEVNLGGATRRVAFAKDGSILVANEGGWVDILR